MTRFLNYYKESRFFQFIIILILSILLGLAWFIFLFNRYPLYLTNVNWIYKAGHDVFQHQIGWEWFRQEPWRFPLGRIVSYGYPFGTYVAYMDAIPIMAFLFKLISPLITQNVQYLGVWSLLSIIGQILMGMLILGEFTTSIFKRILGGSLLVLSEIFLVRFFAHTAFTTQWLLLAGIWFIILEYRQKLWRGAWLVLFFVATLIQVYFVAMLLPLWAISLYFRYSKKQNRWMLLLDVVSVVSVLLIVSYSIGLFSLGITSVGKATYGYYSWNLNGLINPTYSSLLSQMPTGTNGQYEGYSYLGLGNLIILPFALILFLKKDFSKQKLLFFLPFVIVSIALMLFALTNKAFVNDHPLWNFQLPGIIFKYISAFHSSGRFIWPVFYFIVLFGIISIVRNTRYATLCLALVLLIQLVDLRQIYSSKKFTGFVEFQPKLQSQFWQAAAKTNQHVFLMWDENTLAIYEPVALYALQNKLTLNWGWFSRGDYDAIGKSAMQTWEGLKNHQADKRTIYIFLESAWDEQITEYFSGYMGICRADGYIAVLSIDNALFQPTQKPIADCAYP